MRTIAIEEHATTETFLKATSQVQHIPGRPVQMRAEGMNARLLDVGAGRLADMDANRIDMQVLSLSSAGLDKLAPADATALMRDTNDEFAAAVRLHPDRYAAFATLALQQPEQAAAELERCIGRLGFKGMIAMGTIQGGFLDDARFSPVFEAANAMQVPIYLHPGLPPRPVIEAYYSGLPGAAGATLAAAGWGFHAETGMHCLRLILSGLFDRFCGVHIIIGHMGEHLPYNVARADWVFERLRRTGEILPFKRRVIEYFRDHFYITTSGYFTVPPLLCAVQVLGIDRVLFAVDYPLAPNALAREFLDTVPLEPGDLEKISHGNAELLLKL